ncbi:hypothetical protein [Antrihabitans sp. YC2-6]|uniref:hypothetical protein n=1 Tax=Antrihabitans sp. YC2-6 TaxID=2799498 RepID=UPI0018F4B447|nr:hypothetical protein [Antrihabitans sp. YC2-6]MBJ8348730.1 hypothetical protein [Antrihabitans sp. YC2-6]
MFGNWRAVAGLVAAVLAVAAGMILINACGLGDADEKVVPPQIRPATSISGTGVSSGSLTPAFTVPPSPTWQIAPETTPRTIPETTTRTSTTRTTTTRTTRGTTTSSEDGFSEPESERDDLTTSRPARPTESETP